MMRSSRRPPSCEMAEPGSEAHSSRSILALETATGAYGTNESAN